jgi:hypothetical protein
MIMRDIWNNERTRARETELSIRADSGSNDRFVSFAQLRGMLQPLFFGVVMMLMLSTAFAITAVHGTIKSLDSAAKTFVVKTADGTEHTFKLGNSTVIHGTKKTVAGTKDAFRGLKEGSEVAVHYTVKGSDKTAEEIDYTGKDGLKATEGTVTRIDRSGKVLALKTAKGTEETFRMSDNAAEDAGKEIEAAGDKSGKVTVYYTEEAGRKIAHFFEKSL